MLHFKEMERTIAALFLFIYNEKNKLKLIKTKINK